MTAVTNTLQRLTFGRKYEKNTEKELLIAEEGLRRILTRAKTCLKP